MAIFKGVDPEYGKTSTSFISDEASTIKQALINILTYDAKSRFMRPEMESPLHNYLFRAVNNDNAKMLFIEIDRLIRAREPRVKLNLLQSSVIADTVNRMFKVTLVYRNARTNEVDTLEQELRGVS